MLDHPHGHHGWDVSVGSLDAAFVKKTFTINIFYICSSAAVRVSIFLLIHRLFGHVRSTRRLIWAGLSITVAAYAAMLISHIYYCAPRPGPEQWTLVAYSRCGSPDITISIAQAAFGSAVDVLLFVMPVTYVLRLNMPLRRRIGIVGIFMTGLL